MWGVKWPIPVYDEPEDNPEGWGPFLASVCGPFAVAHWDIAKAKRLGVWSEEMQGLAFLVWNWYPACSAVPWYGRLFYVPFKVIQYRLQSKRSIPCYLTLWSRVPETDEHGHTYWRDSFLNRWSWFWFRILMWPRATGKAYF